MYTSYTGKIRTRTYKTYRTYLTDRKLDIHHRQDRPGKTGNRIDRTYMTDRTVRTDRTDMTDRRDRTHMTCQNKCYKQDTQEGY